MKDDLRTAMRAFRYFSSIAVFWFGVIFSILGKDVLKGFAYGSIAGIGLSVFSSVYLLLGLILFRRKLLFYSNFPEQLHKHKVKNIYYESVAANTTSGRIKYGGLFLTDRSVLFIPHRFAIIRTSIEIPFEEIKQVIKVRIDLRKFFSGGLRPRLDIEMVTNKHYEFGVWDIDMWIKRIQKAKDESAINATLPCVNGGRP